MQNILANHKANWARPKYQGVYIVADKKRVTDQEDQRKAVDKQDIYDDLVQLAFEYEKHGWIYNAEYTIDRLMSENLVTVRAGGTGFDTTFPFFFSGAASVFNNLVQGDIDISVLANV